MPISLLSVVFVDWALDCCWRIVHVCVRSVRSFLQKWPGADFIIYIVEQTNDGRKFNRGKLLNVGFDLAKKDGCAVVVFHDVDLLPSDELLPFYCTVPEPRKPCHIARVRRRLSYSRAFLLLTALACRSPWRFWCMAPSLRSGTATTTTRSTLAASWPSTWRTSSS